MSIEKIPSLEPTSITFHGADGSGKSTIANSLSELMSDNNARVVSIGGSTYKQWLTPEIAKTFLNNSSRLEDPAITFEEKTLLYEDIAVACYGHMNRLVEDGAHVVIDSDPYLKRFMWSYSEQSQEQYLRYRTYFEEKMFEMTGTVAPKNIIGVNFANQDTTTAEQTYFDRIILRQSNSEYDPSDLSGVRDNLNAAGHIWEDITNNRRYIRLEKSNVFNIENGECSPDTISVNALKSARAILNKLR